jgi:uncharacterized protein (DUF4415 family)
MTDDDIARAVADDPDAVPLNVDWDKANLVIPPGKDIITLRLDCDLLDWLRSQGKGYQTLINKVLRTWYEAARKREKTEAAKQTRDREEVRKAVVAAKKTAAKKAAAAAAKRPAPAKKRSQNTEA